MTMPLLTRPMGVPVEECPACQRDLMDPTQLCRCTDAQRLDAEVRAGRFMAPDAPMTAAEALAALRGHLEGHRAADRVLGAATSPGYVLIPDREMAQIVAALGHPGAEPGHGGSVEPARPSAAA